MTDHVVVMSDSDSDRPLKPQDLPRIPHITKTIKSNDSGVLWRQRMSGENEVDLMGRARVMYQDESRNSPFNHDKAWAILRSDDDKFWIERKKAQIKAKLRAEMPMEPNNEDDSDE
nr:hypothetical protein [Tanacetum cinerariifolium]